MTVNDRDAIKAYSAAVGRLGGRLAASGERFIAAFQADPSDPATMTAITTETQEWRRIQLEALSLDPPPAARGVHTRTLRWFAQMVAAADDIDAGFAADDVAQIQAGIAKGEVAGKLAKDANRSAARLAQRLELQSATPVWRRP